MISVAAKRNLVTAPRALEIHSRPYQVTWATQLVDKVKASRFYHFQKKKEEYATSYLECEECFSYAVNLKHLSRAFPKAMDSYLDPHTQVQLFIILV